MLGHPTKSCYHLKGNLRALVDVRAHKLCPVKKMFSSYTTSFLQFGQSSPVPAMVNPIPNADLWFFKTDLHQCQEKGLVPDPIPDGGVTCVHPELIEDEE